MNLDDIKRTHVPRQSRKRVGRGTGSGLGRTSGRGHKGVKARSGGLKGLLRREGGQMALFRRLPKRGFNNRWRKEFVVVNVSIFQDERLGVGGVVDPEKLRDLGLLGKNLYDGLKILGHGDLTKKLTVRAHRFSEAAVRKIEAAGGTVERIEAGGKTS